MSGHLVIAETTAGQPFHLRAVGGNGEPVLAGENLTSETTAENAVLFLAQLFGWQNPRLLTTSPDATAETLHRPEVAVLVCDNVDAHVVIRYVDERPHAGGYVEPQA